MPAGCKAPRAKAGGVVRMHRMEGRCAIVLDSQERLDPGELGEALKPLGFPWAEVTRSCRRQRGILMRRVDELLATAACDALRDVGIRATPVPESELPNFRRWISASSAQVDDLGIRIPALEALGKQGFLPWEDLQLAHACLCEGETATTLGGLADLISKGGTDHEDHQRIARECFERGAMPTFEWGKYLDTEPEEAVNPDRLKRTKEAKPRRKLFAVRPAALPTQRAPKARYAVGNPELEGRLLLHGGDGLALVLHGGQEQDATAITIDGERIAGHWLRGLHGVAMAVLERARAAMLTPSLRSLASRENPAVVVAPDLAVFEDESRWWLGRLLSVETTEMLAAAEEELK